MTLIDLTKFCLFVKNLAKSTYIIIIIVDLLHLCLAINVSIYYLFGNDLDI